MSPIKKYCTARFARNAEIAEIVIFIFSIENKGNLEQSHLFKSFTLYGECIFLNRAEALAYIGNTLVVHILFQPTTCTDM
ncbi:MAG: hypothetical protein DRI24_00320 [Deltaproteobacteria bacterium]|nr:MAG: hypothetical protein DRI24_00320 [Deltaproteobacteria bacterium]